MPLPQTVQAQSDFSAGEVSPSIKRDDSNPLFKTGLRQCRNFRILNTKKLANRFGRSIKFVDGPRMDDVLMSPGNVFTLCFSAGRIRVRDVNGAQVFTSTVLGDGATSIPWTANNVNQIVWDTYRLAIYICFPGIVPQVLSWDGASTWTLSTYTEAIAASGQKRTAFYRLAPQSITLAVSATTGVATLTFSSNVLVNGMIGTRIRYAGRQMQIKTVASGLSGTATIVENLPPCQVMTLTGAAGQYNVGDVVTNGGSAKGIVTSSPSTQTISFAIFTAPITAFLIGDSVSGGTSGATGTVTGVNYWNDDPSQGIEALVVLLAAGSFVASETITGPHGSVANTGVTGTALTIQIIANDVGNITLFVVGDNVIGPAGSAKISTVSTVQNGQAISVWDQEIMNSYQGYPAACFVDQGRLGFCNFPALPNAVVWSAFGLLTDLYANDASSPDNAIFELAPGKCKVQYVVPGIEASEFVFTDVAVYYIPITPTNPLKPGSVGFQTLSTEGVAAVQPRAAQESIAYIAAGGKGVRVVTATGAYLRPYEVRRISDNRDHLFNSPVVIAAPGATDPNFSERYVYVLNGDGTVAVAAVKVENGQITGEPGWALWSGVGAVKWVSSRTGSSNVWFGTTYSTGPVTIAELGDATQYLDAAISYNSVPTALTPPGGKGPLWWYAGGTVTLMDQSTRPMGTYSVDANGFIVPQNNAGENLAAASLVAGQPWTATAETFIAAPGPGQDVKQRMVRRKISRMGAAVQNSTGFLLARLFGGPLRPGGPALGTTMNIFRVTPWNQDDDPTLPPPQREWSYLWRPSGRSYDPRVALIKDTPGPLTVLELGYEITV